jgi:dienelactone hydrolase
MEENLNNILVEGGGSAVRDVREPVRRCASRALIRRILVLATVGGAVMSVMLVSPAQAEPRQLTFPVKIAERAGERRALVCAPKGPPPFAAVVFNHGSIVDMLGWPGATQRRYRLDRVCEALAAEGYFVFAPIRENSARGRGFHDYEDAYREIVLQAIDHVKALARVDSSRIALAGFSMGGLVSFKVALERSDLRAVALLAPAFGRGLLDEAAKSAERISAPVLVMVEQSDGAPILRGVGILEQALGLHGKPLRLVRYDRGGGHELFYDVGYWWDDLKAFLHEHLVAR